MSSRLSNTLSSPDGEPHRRILILSPRERELDVTFDPMISALYRHAEGRVTETKEKLCDGTSTNEQSCSLSVPDWNSFTPPTQPIRCGLQTILNHQEYYEIVTTAAMTKAKLLRVEIENDFPMGEECRNLQGRSYRECYPIGTEGKDWPQLQIDDRIYRFSEVDEFPDLYYHSIVGSRMDDLVDIIVIVNPEAQEVQCKENKRAQSPRNRIVKTKPAICANRPLRGKVVHEHLDVRTPSWLKPRADEEEVPLCSPGELQEFNKGRVYIVDSGSSSDVV